MIRLNNRLTRREKECLAFCEGYFAQFPRSPKLQEIADALHASRGNVHAWLSSLEERGYITRNPRKRRAIKIVGKECPDTDMTELLICPRCDGGKAPEAMYCAPCRKEMSENGLYKDDAPISQETKRRARAYANVYQRRGLIVPQPCVVCGSAEAEKHHRDYSRPLAITWLCRNCHKEHHDRERPDVS